MERSLRSMTVRQWPDNGYTLVELLLVLFVLSVSSALFYPAMNTDLSTQQFYLIKSDLIRLQSECMAFQKEETLDIDAYSFVYEQDIRFNERGHVNRAQTIRFIKKKGVIELGNGVFVEK